MPEGHVIHRLAQHLNATFGAKLVHTTSPQGRFATEASVLDGTRFEHAEAVGKHLFLHFDSASAGPEHIVHIHLGLIGHMRFEPREKQWGQTRLRIELADDASTSETSLAVNLRGPQWCRLISEADYAEAVAKTGEDPLRADADPEKVWRRVSRSTRSIASLLMDQKLFAGVGNIYRAEVLFRHRQPPHTPGTELDRAVFFALWQDLVDLMRHGVIDGEINTVLPEHLPETMGRPPRDDEHGGEVYVYRRAGAPCLICGTEIAITALDGRNLFWCPTCQG